MGMFYASEAHANKVARSKEEGQARRDRLKCLGIEKLLGAKVYTIDNKHGFFSEDGSQSEPGRHYYGNFNGRRCINGVMNLISGDVSLVLFDLYFIFEGSWIQNHWAPKTLFEEAIPGCRFFTAYLNCSYIYFIYMISALWDHLSPNGKIYLPHFKDIHDEMTPAIYELYEVRVITDKLENPLIQACLELESDEIVDFSWFNNLYLVERKVDNVMGYCIVLTKIAAQIAMSAPEQEEKNRKLKDIRESVSQFRGRLALRERIPSAVPFHTEVIAPSSNSWPLHHLSSITKGKGKGVRGKRIQNELPVPTPPPKAAKSSKTPVSLKTPQEVQEVKIAKSTTILSEIASKGKRNTPASTPKEFNLSTSNSAQRSLEGSMVVSEVLNVCQKVLSQIEASTAAKDEFHRSEIMGLIARSDAKSAAKDESHRSEIMDLIAKSDAKSAAKDESHRSEIMELNVTHRSEIIDLFTKSETNTKDMAQGIKEMAVKTMDMAAIGQANSEANAKNMVQEVKEVALKAMEMAADSQRNIMKMTENNDARTDSHLKSVTDNSYNLQVFEKIKDLSPQQLEFAKGLMK